MEPHPALSVIIAIVIAILAASFLFSVGYAAFVRPVYSDYCAQPTYRANLTSAQIAAQDAAQTACSAQYQHALDRTTNGIFYVVAILGVIVALGALVANPRRASLRFYIVAGVIFGSIAAILIATMQDWSEMSRFVRPIVLLVEIVLVVFVASRLFRTTDRSRRKAERRGAKAAREP